MQNDAPLGLSRPRLATTLVDSLPPDSTLFCDFDGPIVDVSDRYYTTYTLALAATETAYAGRGITLPIRRLTKAQFWQMKQNRVADPVIADWSGLSAAEIPDFLAHVETWVNRAELLSYDGMQPGAKAALTGLQNRGIRIVIVTLRQASQVLSFLQQHELATSITQIYGAQDDSAAYPNRVEHKIARLQDAIADQHRLGFETTASWMIGDTEADICAGQAVGLPTIALGCGVRSAAYLKGFRPTCTHRDLYAAVQWLCRRRPVARYPQPNPSLSYVC